MQNQQSQLDPLVLWATSTWRPDVPHQRHKLCEPVLLLSEESELQLDSILLAYLYLTWESEEIWLQAALPDV